MKEKSFPKCPICKKDIMSDANLRDYCQLCGMALEDTDDFCCLECRNKFLITRGGWQ